MDTTQLNTYKLKEIADEIADDILTSSKSDLVRIPEFLHQKLGVMARRAQSIIIRSEAEILGISSPRFATRVYLEGGGFINCRRIAFLIKTAEEHRSQESASENDSDSTAETPLESETAGVRHPAAYIDKILRNNSCVADSLLAEPERLRKRRFRYVDTTSARLFDIYAEPIADHLSRAPYTPYVKPMEFGGGACAQAVCFMATAALSGHAANLCGLAEITTFAHEPDCLELTLSGLTALKMQRYFNRVGLNMITQSPDTSCRPFLTSSQQREVATALRCYLRSEMPVILPVDCRKLASLPSADESIYHDNAFIVSPSVFPKDAPHAIIVFGYSEISDEFVFHDPFAWPYMAAPFSQLGTVGCEQDINPKIADNGVFMPVTPARVRMPLHWERAEDASGELELRAGLFLISKMLHVLLHNLTRPNPFSTGHLAPFFLSSSPVTVENLVGIAPDYQELLRSEIANCSISLRDTNNWQVPHWCWYELHTDSVWIWDAEIPPKKDAPQTLSECTQYLLAVVRIARKEGKEFAESILISP